MREGQRRGFREKRQGSQRDCGAGVAGHRKTLRRALYDILQLYKSSEKREKGCMKGKRRRTLAFEVVFVVGRMFFDFDELPVLNVELRRAILGAVSIQRVNQRRVCGVYYQFL